MAKTGRPSVRKRVADWLSKKSADRIERMRANRRMSVAWRDQAEREVVRLLNKDAARPLRERETQLQRAYRTAEHARKQARKDAKKLARVEARHSTGVIGRTIRRIRGQKPANRS